MKKNQPLVIALCVLAILVCGVVAFKSTAGARDDNANVSAITDEIRKNNVKGPDLPPDPNAISGGRNAKKRH